MVGSGGRGGVVEMERLHLWRKVDRKRREGKERTKQMKKIER